MPGLIHQVWFFVRFTNQPSKPRPQRILNLPFWLWGANLSSPSKLLGWVSILVFDINLDPQFVATWAVNWVIIITLVSLRFIGYSWMSQNDEPWIKFNCEQTRIIITRSDWLHSHYHEIEKNMIVLEDNKQDVEIEGNCFCDMSTSWQTSVSAQVASILHLSFRMSRWRNSSEKCSVKYEQTEQEYSRAKMKVLRVYYQ